MATLQRVAAQNYTADQVREIISAAIEIADSYELQAHRWQPVFIQACQLLGQQSVTFVAENPIPNFALPNGLPR